MARIRSLKPEFWHDRKLARTCSRDARMLYMGLWNLADEWARVNGDPAYIKGQIFPYDSVDVPVLLAELVAAGRVEQYSVDGDPYLTLPKLSTHQRLEPHRVESKIPAPPNGAEPSPDPPSPARADSSERHADSSERDADSSEPHATSNTLLYVAGSMDRGGAAQTSARRASTAPPSDLDRHRRTRQKNPPPNKPQPRLPDPTRFGTAT